MSPLLQAAVPPAPTTYDVDGVRYPRVTSVLTCLAKPGLDRWYRRHGFEKCDELSKTAREFGTRLHAVIERVNNGEFIKDSSAGFDADLFPHVEAYARWFADNVAEVLAVERRVVSRWHRYAGTVDFAALLKDGSRAVVDYKTADKAGVYPEHRAQTAAYRLALAEEGTVTNRRLILQFLKSDPGRLVVHDLDNHRRDTEAWLSILEVYRWLNG